MPVWVWNYYHVRRIVGLGLRTKNENVVAGRADIDIADDRAYVRSSSQKMILNWLAPSAKPTFNNVRIDGYLPIKPGDSVPARRGTGLLPEDLTWNGGEWMPVLEPVTKPAPNYAVLGYSRDEVIFDEPTAADD